MPEEAPKSKYPKTLFNIVLVEPEIPNNTGNVGRTCVGLCSKLHLVKPLAFEITDKQLKRAGLDYWPNLDWEIHEGFAQWLETVPDPSRVFLLSTKSEKTIFDVELQAGDYLVFGKETKGLSAEILERFPEQMLKVPMLGKIRSYNLANAVAMVLGEGVRQLESAGQI